MSKTMKNFLMIFTALCILALVVFTIELMVINGGSGGEQSSGDNPTGGVATGEDSKTSDGQPESPGTSGSGGSPDNADPDGGSGNAQGTGSPEGNGDSTGATNPGGTQTEPPGTRKTIDLPAENGEIVYYIVEIREGMPVFEYIDTSAEFEEGIGRYDYLGNTKTALELRYVHIPQGLGARAANYLEEFYDIPDAEVKGEGPIRNSELNGYYMTGEKDGVTYEAWIYAYSEFGNDDAGIAFIISYRNDVTKPVLYEIIDSLKLVK